MISHRQEELNLYLNTKYELVDLATIKDDDYRIYDDSDADITKRMNDWVSALRSGNYVQGTQYLRNISGDVDPETGGIVRLDSSFCCLGVLLDIDSPGGWWDGSDDIVHEVEEDSDDPTQGAYYDLHPNMNHHLDNQEGSLIDEDYAHELGLTQPAQGILSSLNDRGATFEQIALVIESNDFRTATTLIKEDSDES
jgi:hypothetical protein